MSDTSNGYEKVAETFMSVRSDIGASAVSRWAAQLAPSATVLDLGCGNGIPITKVLVDYGLSVYALDASPTMAADFQQNYPNVPLLCEPVEQSSFFDRQFDGILAWGLIFLLQPQEQETVLKRIIAHLNPGGRLFFTAPMQKCQWQDVLTGLTSESLGADEYGRILIDNQMKDVEGSYDEAGNHYITAFR